MTQNFTRRDMVKTSAAIAGGCWLGTSANQAAAASSNDKLNIAVVGIGGRGRANLNALGGENIVALCDVDEQRAGNAYEKFPKAKKFTDFRRMFDAMDKQIDAVVVSTPDHTHFHPSMAAMELGKHLYCEKPMAHTVEETRRMTDMAAKSKVATQLGVQRHTIDNVHRVVELVQAGAIGQVTEVHSWIGGSRGMPAAPTDRPAVPKHLDWDLWLGPAASRPYSPAFAPYNWRFWWDFGTGETGNWGCHILDIPFWALGLKYPTRVDASGPSIDGQRTPKSMATKFAFAADGDRKALTLHWYHNSNPPILKKHDLSGKGANTLFIGSEGMLLCGFGMRKLLPEEQFEGVKAPARSIPNSPGFHREWINACKGGPAATCEFGYSGPLTETVLLGNAAYRAGGGFDWNANSLQSSGNDNAENFLRPHFREGWKI